MEEFSKVFGASILFFLLSAMIFVPLEEVFHVYPKSRPKAKDLLLFWFYPSLGLWLMMTPLLALAFHVRSMVPAGWQAAVHGQPFWLQVTEALFLAEVWVYASHRMFHAYAFLWRFHRVHHTVRHMTWSATFRQHPVDFFVVVIGANFPALLLGIDPVAISVFLGAERLYTILQHSNLTFGLGRAGKIFSSPRFHHLHHKSGRRGCNYGGMTSFLDVIGKSYK